MPLATYIVKVLEALLEALSNLFIVMLFTVYLLLTPSPRSHPDAPLANTDEASVSSEAAGASVSSHTDADADRQINLYIRGKVLVSLLVAGVTALTLGALGVDLWLVFGVLAFWLNFIPTVGTLVAVLIPMPLVLLDPQFSTPAVVLAFAIPLAAHTFAGNVLEPLMFGQVHNLSAWPYCIHSPDTHYTLTLHSDAQVAPCCRAPLPPGLGLALGSYWDGTRRSPHRRHPHPPCRHAAPAASARRTDAGWRHRQQTPTLDRPTHHLSCGSGGGAA